MQHIVDYLTGVELTVSIPAEGEDPEEKFMIQVPEEFTTMTVKQMNTSINPSSPAKSVAVCCSCCS